MDDEREQWMHIGDYRTVFVFSKVLGIFDQLDDWIGEGDGSEGEEIGERESFDECRRFEEVRRVEGELVERLETRELFSDWRVENGNCHQFIEQRADRGDSEAKSGDEAKNLEFEFIIHVNCDRNPKTCISVGTVNVTTKDQWNIHICGINNSELNSIVIDGRDYYYPQSASGLVVCNSLTLTESSASESSGVSRPSRDGSLEAMSSLVASSSSAVMFMLTGIVHIRIFLRFNMAVEFGTMSCELTNSLSGDVLWFEDVYKDVSWNVQPTIDSSGLDFTVTF